jgi:hypothetical protein
MLYVVKTRAQLVTQLMMVFNNNFGRSSGAMGGGNTTSGGDLSGEEN